MAEAEFEDWGDSLANGRDAISGGSGECGAAWGEPD